MIPINVFVAYQFAKAKVKRTEREMAIKTAAQTVQSKMQNVELRPQTFDLKPIDQIFTQIQDLIEQAGIFVADISELNSNVIFELGYAFGVATTKAKRLVILCHESVDLKKLPSDLSGMYVVRYRTNKFQGVFEKELRRASEGYVEAVKKGELEEIGVKSFWRYNDGQDVDIICSELPPNERPDYAEPGDRNYLRYGSFADLDSLIHVRTNLQRLFPRLRMRDFTASEHRVMGHNGLVVLGGPAWNPRFRALQKDLPLYFEDREQEDDDVLVVKGQRGRMKEYRPRYDGGRVRDDISVVCRMSDVQRRTTFLFAGSLTFGVLGACKAFLNKACGVTNAQILEESVGDDDFVTVFRSNYRDDEVMPPRLDIQRPLYLFRRKANEGGEFACVQDNSAKA